MGGVVGRGGGQDASRIVPSLRAECTPSCLSRPHPSIICTHVSRACFVPGLCVCRVSCGCCRLQVASKYSPVSCTIIGVDLMPIKPIPNVITHTEDITGGKVRQLLQKDLKGQKVRTRLASHPSPSLRMPRPLLLPFYPPPSPLTLTHSSPSHHHLASRTPF